MVRKTTCYCYYYYHCVYLFFYIFRLLQLIVLNIASMNTATIHTGTNLNKQSVTIPQFKQKQCMNTHHTLYFIM